ncbi:MAG: hypothetical protein J5747_00470 [Spirochaetaceae bacterium]|nr:hypothetical protein [Spirochaetaceae bacterium]
MANLTEEAKWESGIYQLEITDPLQGGADGIDNVQAKQLANRTLFLKEKNENTQNSLAPVETSETAANAYAIGDQFILNDILYTATAAISIGDEIEEGVNCAESDTLVKQLKDHEEDSANPHGTTAAQVGAYTKEQTDVLISEIHASARVDESKARNLLDVLGIRSVHSDDPATADEAKACILEMHTRLDGGDTSWYRDGDYLDVPSITVDGTTYTWNSSYKNLRLVNMGLNVYKHAGDTENTKDHVVMQFRNCVLEKRMNATDTNSGGYPASELYAWLNDKFKTGLIAALGNYLYTVRRLLSTKGGWSWADDTVFLPTECEVWGSCIWSEAGYGGGFQAQWPAYRDSAVYKVKTYNGSRKWWWEASPYKDDTASFCYCGSNGSADTGTNSGSAGGISPAICVA